MLTKITSETSTTNIIEQIEYEYNLQNRLKKQTVKDGATPTPNILSTTTYTYNENGIRVKSKHFDGTDTTTTLHLVDSYNHTGYAQTIEESTYGMADPNPAVDTPDEIMYYTIGDDVISQAKAEYDGGWTINDTEYLLYDGHGSTRQVVDSSGISDVHNYDAYGVSVGYDSATPKTDLRYAGEYFDENMSNYYLRARWYDTMNGRFNRVDPFSGNYSDPQSLHKYLYCHANPVNAIDPSGEGIVTGIIFIMLIFSLLFGIKQHFFCKFFFLLNQQIRFRSPFLHSYPNTSCLQSSPH